MKTLRCLTIAVYTFFVCYSAFSQSTIQINSETGIITINGQETTPQKPNLDIYNAYSLSKLLYNYPKEFIDEESAIKIYKALKWYESEEIEIPQVFLSKIISSGELDLSNIDIDELKNISDTVIRKQLIKIKEKIKNLNDSVKNNNTQSLDSFLGEKSNSIKSEIDSLIKTLRIYQNDSLIDSDSIRILDSIQIINFIDQLKTKYSKGSILEKLGSDKENILLKIESLNNSAYNLVLKLDIKDIEKIYNIKQYKNNLSGIDDIKRFIQENDDDISLSSELVIKLSEQSSSSPFSF